MLRPLLAITLLIMLIIACYLYSQNFHNNKVIIKEPNYSYSKRFQSNEWVPLELENENLLKLKTLKIKLYLFLNYRDTDKMHSDLMEISNPVSLFISFF
jgi:hypothetical protein